MKPFLRNANIQFDAHPVIVGHMISTSKFINLKGFKPLLVLPNIEFKGRNNVCSVAMLCFMVG